MSEPSLFDSIEGGVPCQDGAGESPARSTWTECTIEAFFTMSDAELLDYCARRDEDTARFCEPEDQAFFLERAAWYRQRREEIK